METQVVESFFHLLDIKAIAGIVLICFYLFEHSPKGIRKFFMPRGRKTLATMVVALIVSAASYLYDPSNPPANILAYFIATSFYEIIVKRIKSRFEGPAV